MEKAPFEFVYHNYGDGRILKVLGDFRAGRLMSVFSPLFMELVNTKSVDRINLFDVVYMDSSAFGLIKYAEESVEIMWQPGAHAKERYDDWSAGKVSALNDCKDCGANWWDTRENCRVCHRCGKTHG